MTLVVQEVAINSVRPWEKNPRLIRDAEFARLVKSLREEPEMMQARPLICLPSGEIIAGNMRWRAAQELGWATIPAVTVDLDEQRAAEWNLRDNVAYGAWDESMLAELMYELQEAGADMELTGFDPSEIQKLLDSVSANGQEDVRGTELALADVTLGDPEHLVALGHVWQVGPHILVCEHIYDGWPVWTPYLTEGALLIPYPTPALPLTEQARIGKLVMIQPDEWLAGHLLDKYVAVMGDEDVIRL